MKGQWAFAEQLCVLPCTVGAPGADGVGAEVCVWGRVSLEGRQVCRTLNGQRKRKGEREDSHTPLQPTCVLSLFHSIPHQPTSLPLILSAPIPSPNASPTQITIPHLVLMPHHLILLHLTQYLHPPKKPGQFHMFSH